MSTDESGGPKPLHSRLNSDGAPYIKILNIEVNTKFRQGKSSQVSKYRQEKIYLSTLRERIDTDVIPEQCSCMMTGGVNSETQQCEIHQIDPMVRNSLVIDPRTRRVIT